MAAADLIAAAEAVELARGVVHDGVRTLRAGGGPDVDQVLGYDLSHAAAAVETAHWMLDYGAHGELEAQITCAFVADAIGELTSRLFGREATWGIEVGALDGARGFCATYRDRSSSPGSPGKRAPGTSTTTSSSCRTPSGASPRTSSSRSPSTSTATTTTSPKTSSAVSARWAPSACRSPRSTAATAVAASPSTSAWSSPPRSSAGAASAPAAASSRGPEIFARALVTGGTEEQKHEWLPKLATAEVLNAIAVTEPDVGSDSATVTTSATRTEGGWLLNGVKTWCTFGARADVLLLLARTDPDRSIRHKGLSLFIVPKERGNGHGFELTQEGGGKMEGRAIDTIGYRGMHSYEIAFDSWFVDDANLVGGEEGIGRGFYLQMAGFENGRLQTAARAIGVMQAAYEAAKQYAADRVVFDRPIAEFQLTQVKLARMAITIQAARQASYAVARQMAKGRGTLEAAMLKAYVCKAAEWVTREAMQIHGGMGYAEEYDVSRYFVDARVLSIFEGADEILCLKLIARRMIETAG